MRYVIATMLSFVCLILIASPSKAMWDMSGSEGAYRDYRVHRDYNRRHVAYSGNVASSEDCNLAARLGGPCGCLTAHHFGLPHVFKKINLWLADNWRYMGPRVSYAGPGVVVIWPHRHVGWAIADHGNTVTVGDTYGTRTVSKAGKILVKVSSR